MVLEGEVSSFPTPLRRQSEKFMQDEKSFYLGATLGDPVVKKSQERVRGGEGV